MKSFIAGLLALFILPLPAHGQMQEGTSLQATKIQDDIFLIVNPEGGGNITVSTGEDGIFLIDNQLSHFSKEVLAAVSDIAEGEIEFILNTHYHFDHTGGNEFFGERNAVIIAHNNVRKRLSTGEFISYFNRQIEPLSSTGLPVITFPEEIALYYNGNDIQVIHTPEAHTDGDALVHFKNRNVIVAGDIVFNGTYPFIDVEHGGSIQGMIAATEKILELAGEQTVIIPGHGQPMNMAELQDYRDMLVTITNRVEAAIDNGKGLEETLATNPTAEFDQTLNTAFISPEDFISFAYQSLTR